MVLAMQGTPWDAKGKLATHTPTMGGAIITPAAATASSSRAEGSTDRAANTTTGRAEGSTERQADGAASTK
eukprot:1127869-Amphidinium_carterae.1